MVMGVVKRRFSQVQEAMTPPLLSGPEIKEKPGLQAKTNFLCVS